MTRFLKSSASAIIGLIVATSAWAQAETQTPSAPSGPAAAATTTSLSPSAISAAELKLRTPVIGADGRKIGVINGISTSADGKVATVEVALGTKTGIDAKSFRVPADKITVTGSNVSVSMTSEDARKAAADAAYDQGNS